MSDFETFVAKEHQKRVTHFVRYCTSENRAPRIADAIEIFGFCKRDATPIVEDAIKQMAAA
jgi:hypothetical protein